MSAVDLTRVHKRVKRWALDRQDDEPAAPAYEIATTDDHPDDAAISLTLHHGAHSHTLRAPLWKWNHAGTDYCTYLLNIAHEKVSESERNAAK